MKIYIITPPNKLCTKREMNIGALLVRQNTWLAFVGLFVKVFMHSSTMVHVRSPILVG